MTKVKGSFTVSRIPTRIIEWGASDEAPTYWNNWYPPRKDSFTTQQKIYLFGKLRWVDEQGNLHVLGGKRCYLRIIDESGKVVVEGTSITGSGAGEFHNNPDEQGRSGYGPLKPGRYTFELEFPGDETYEDGQVQSEIYMVSAPFEVTPENAAVAALSFASVAFVGGAIAYHELIKLLERWRP